MDFKKCRTWNLDSGLSIREALMKKNYKNFERGKLNTKLCKSKLTFPDLCLLLLQGCDDVLDGHQLLTVVIAPSRAAPPGS